jgi:hypothetical protein
MKQVKEKTLVWRINRSLAVKGQMLRKSRSTSPWYESTGDYYLYDAHTNAVLETHVDLEAFARDMGRLRNYEEIVWTMDAYLLEASKYAEKESWSAE